MQKQYITNNLKNDYQTTRGTRWTLEVNGSTHVFMGSKQDAVNYFTDKFDVKEPQPKRRKKVNVKNTAIQALKVETK